MFDNVQLRAGGTIRPCRFIKIDTSADYQALESDAGELSIGVSGQAAQDAPIPNASANAAEDGDPFRFFPPGTVALLEVGTGGVTRGDKIVSDADGKGVTADATGTDIQWLGALALESSAAGEKARVLVLPPTPYRPDADSSSA